MAFYSYINNKQFYHILASCSSEEVTIFVRNKKGKHDAVWQEISDVLSLALPSSCFAHVVRAVNDTENPVLISCTGNITTTSNEEQTVSKKNTASQSLLMENLVKPHRCCHNNDEAIIKGKVESFLESIPKLN